MKKINFAFLFPSIVLAVLVFALSIPFFALPPAGKLLDPFTGLVQNENDKVLNNSSLTIRNPELIDSVQVFFDNRQVPHIYAKNSDDLYFAQGYVTAYLRLWQIDFMSYASAGRLSEIIKDGFLDHDREKRRIGMLDAAKKSLKLIETDAETMKALTAFSKGVNHYIAQLDIKDLPVEYKILGYRPESWSPLKTVLIMKYMANMLTGYEEDLINTNLMLALGEEKFNKYFSDMSAPIAPVMNSTNTTPNTSLAYIKKPAYLDYSFFSAESVIAKSTYNPLLGSNSWVVSGKKTKSGFPILCNDPHLGLSLPAIWMEMQLSMPGMNLYGVSIPGTPAVIIGFNENIAWGLTNGSDDVRDWYKLKISNDYTKYFYDGKWNDLEFTVEEIKRRDQEIFYDTIYHTVHGPIVYCKQFRGSQPKLMDHALKWELHNPSNEIRTFLELGRAKNYTDYKKAISHYSCPTQNFTFACKDNTIAVNHQGNMAVKWPGQGKFILDGTKPSHLYSNYIPADSLPFQLDPPGNYVVSANQHPTDINYAWYYNGNYLENRAMRIRQMLEHDNQFDIEKMKAMQLDNTSYFAVDALPVLTGILENSQLDPEQASMLAKIKSWNGAYDISSPFPRIYQAWWGYIEEYTWDELEDYAFTTKAPRDYNLLYLIQHEPGNEYFDNQVTSGKENAADIVKEAFIDALNLYNKQGKIKWGDHNKVSLNHLLNIPQFGVSDLSSAGSPEAINAMSGSWGPSWRMIVELGERPKAFGIYPGGQSGNPGSYCYDNFVGDWNKGKYYALTFYMTMIEARKDAKNCWTLYK